MSELSRKRARLGVVVVLGASVIAFTAGAQNRADPASAEVQMVRQDQADCTNDNVNADDPSRSGGTVWIVRQADGNTTVKVAITASPNTVYHFYLKCVRQLGDIKTQDEGDGIATFEFPTSATGPVYAFDMYPEGAPPGNKFQSVQVKFQ